MARSRKATRGRSAKGSTKKAALSKPTKPKKAPKKKAPKKPKIKSKPKAPKKSKPRAPRAKIATPNGHGLGAALRHLRDLAASTVNPTVHLDAQTPPVRRPITSGGMPLSPVWRSPWSVIARFTFSKPVTYWVIRRVLELWLEDLELEGSITNREIGIERASRINCEWRKGRGDRGEFTLSRGSGPFDATLGEAIERCGDSNNGLIASYEENPPDVDTIILWFGDHSYNKTVEVMARDQD